MYLFLRGKLQQEWSRAYVIKVDQRELLNSYPLTFRGGLAKYAARIIGRLSLCGGCH